MAIKYISTELIARAKAWLSEEGKEFFLKVQREHSDIGIACWDDNGIPHPVHFREGMQVRNFMRQSGLCENWDAHDYDDNWARLIELAIK